MADNDDANADEVELRKNAADKEEHLKSLEYDSDDEEMVAVSEVHVGGQKKALKNVTKVGVDKIVLENIYMVGKQKLVDMNLPAIRLQRKDREIRQSKALHDNLYMFMENRSDSTRIPPCTTKSTSCHTANRMITCRIGGRFIFEKEMSPMELLFLQYWTSYENDIALAERLNRIHQQLNRHMPD
jgi:hypothetical protein